MPKSHVLNRRQLETLTSPIRLAIIQRLDIDKKATASELAQKMGRPVTSLYHHLKLLEKEGLVYIQDWAGVTRPEAVYALIAEKFSSSEAVQTLAGRNAYARAGNRIADAGARALSAAIIGGEARFDGPYRNTTARHHVLRADKRKLAELNRLLAELEEAAAHSGESGEEVQITILLSPLRA